MTRAQLEELGWSKDRIDGSLPRWRTLYRGVQLLHRQPVLGRTEHLVRVWAGALYAGSGAVAWHATALWLAGALEAFPDLVHITVPHHRRVTAQPGLRVHRAPRASRDGPVALGSPSRTPVETAALDVIATTSSAVTVVDTLLRVTQRRLTTAARLRAAAEERPRLRWRVLVMAILAETEDGVTSMLELEYARNVERAHGLPVAHRNQREVEGKRSRYGDVLYEDFVSWSSSTSRRRIRPTGISGIERATTTPPSPVLRPSATAGAKLPGTLAGWPGRSRRYSGPTGGAVGSPAAARPVRMPRDREDLSVVVTGKPS